MRSSRARYGSPTLCTFGQRGVGVHAGGTDLFGQPLTFACKLCANCRREPRTWESVETSTKTIGANEGEVLGVGELRLDATQQDIIPAYPTDSHLAKASQA